MRNSSVFVCTLLSAATLTAQDAATPQVTAVQAPEAPAIEAPLSLEPPAAVEAPAGEEPAPIAPPVVPEPSAIEPTVVPSGATPTIAPSISEVGTLRSSGRTVSEFQNEEIGQVLALLARQASINIVVSDLVQGFITMRLEGLTPLESIRVIVTAKGLIMDQIDNVYYIKTAAEKASEPTESGHFTFSYAQAKDVLPLLKGQIMAKNNTPQFDDRTNTIYYRDYKSNMDNLELFLESIDRPTQQVMIEARLVEVNANPKQNYGINWAGVVGGSNQAQAFTYGGAHNLKIEDLDGALTGTIGDLLLRGSGANPLSAAYGQFAILSVPQMTATLRLMNEDTDAEFLANPRIVTANNLEAKIEVIRNQPVPQLNFNEQTATAVFGGFEDKTFGNELIVRPTINKDDFVTLQVKPKISNKIGDAVFSFAGAEVASPIIDTRAIESNVLIRSGDTLAIGGLLQDEASKTRAKVPVLGDIPILGYAFQERRNERTKRNLLVFVTPTIIKQGYGTGLEDQVSGLKYSGEEFADPNGWRNNARGAVRLAPTSNRQLATDYAKPGRPPEPVVRQNRPVPRYHTPRPGR